MKEILLQPGMRVYVKNPDGTKQLGTFMHNGPQALVNLDSDKANYKIDYEDLELITVKFQKWKCLIVKSKYGNGRVALELIDAYDGQPIARCTTNLVDVPLDDDSVIIKDYSENEGMCDALIDAGVVTKEYDKFALGEWNSCVKIAKLLI